MNVSAEDLELIRLLAQLLRAVSPEEWAPGPGGDSAGSAGPGSAGAEPAGREAGAEGAGAEGAGTAGRPAVSGSEARALLELVAARGIAQGQLGTLLGLEKSTVSRLAAGLERKGLIERGRDEANQRYRRLYLTPEGSEVAARVWRTWQSRQARILAGLSAEERAGLAAGLRGLIRGLAAEGLAAGGPAAQGPAAQGPAAGGPAAQGPAAGRYTAARPTR